MAEDYLTDDEQLEHVKRVVAENWVWVLGGVALGAALIFGYRYYQAYRNDIALRAAAQFTDMTSALERDDRNKSRQIAAGLVKDYPTSPYADQAQLVVARLFVDDGQLANAIAPLTQVMSNSKDTELRHIARLRLARVLIDQGKPDDAIKTLAEDTPGAFAARYHEVRGDAFYAKHDVSGAMTEYKAALSGGDAGSVDSALLQLKIADLGAPAVPATAMAPGATAAPVVKSPSADSSNKAKP
ncbi:MAG TPA: tetratricopeptide repeat protein [Steroidobacteraceae bacterium]|nr:tetratricopeptide repeat protein [Steroidobacteraceae bacterium]